MINNTDMGQITATGTKKHRDMSFNRINRTEKENASEKDIKKVNLHRWGFTTAGRNKGNPDSLRNAMYRIYNGYLSELTGKQNKQTQDINDQIDETKEQITLVTNQISHIENQEIPDQRQQIEDFKNEIEQIRIASEAGFIDSDFNWVKTILFTLFSVMLGMSLVFFYTSLIYNGLFKDYGLVLQSSTVDDSASLFNTLLDVKSLFTINNVGIVLSYLFSSLFLTMPHNGTFTAYQNQCQNRAAKHFSLDRQSSPSDHCTVFRDRFCL